MKRQGWIVGAVMVGAMAALSQLQGAEPEATSVVRHLAVRLTDVEGKVVAMPDNRPAAYVFLSTECPISNKLVPELNRVAEIARKQGVGFYGVLSDPAVSRAEAQQHSKAYQVGFPVLFDASGLLAADLRPSVTPQAFVIDATGHERYSGRVSDAFSAVGVPKGGTPTHDLEDAIVAVAGGKAPAVATTKAVGCVFESWKRPAEGGQVTWARDIAPLVYAQCASCHHEGEVAPFALMTYRDASKRAEMLAQVTGDRVMPPWKAASPAGTFHDERRLSEGEIALFRAWAAAGAPEGNAVDAPPAPAFGEKWQLGTPDLVVKMVKPFSVPASGRDLMAFTVIPLELPKDEYVVGFEYRPGNRKVVHHMIGFLDSRGAARKLAAEKGDGTTYLSFGGPGFLPSGGIGGWAPGATPRFLPEGVGRPLRKGSDLVLNIHYHPSGKPETDQGEIALYFAKKPVEKVAINVPLANRQIDIAPGDANYIRTASIITPVDVTLLGITPHMHMIGRQMRVTARLPDGTSRTLIDVPDWDWNWQDQYQFAAPIKLPRGTKVELWARYDNSKENPRNPQDPPQRVTFGEQTTNEMCLAFLQITVDGLQAPRLGSESPATAEPLRERWKNFRRRASAP